MMNYYISRSGPFEAPISTYCIPDRPRLISPRAARRCFVHSEVLGAHSFCSSTYASLISSTINAYRGRSKHGANVADQKKIVVVARGASLDHQMVFSLLYDAIAVIQLPQARREELFIISYKGASAAAVTIIRASFPNRAKKPPTREMNSNSIFSHTYTSCRTNFRLPQPLLVNCARPAHARPQSRER
ncbi:hypothetical protein EI94DRAFT_1719948 [Lactarius quietus]|nr:hypothetical protein EI94DRAFT_1719948 [Lactarius quietus]